ncbi:hypothetical protein GQ44DRAFT_616949 [Phaeosphaeriaceae sp. PMI808]|nr:hypothetical protein GQ44DRAFT_616949 [Phaeosphaeriaceae sp. PMI808]
MSVTSDVDADASTDPNHLLTVTITNNSQSQQSYALFTADPKISPLTKPIHNDIITVFKGVAGTGGQVFFTIPSAKLYAICGTVNRDAITDGVQTEIVDKQPITLGYKKDDKRLVPGTTCNVTIENGTPIFDRQAAVTPSGKSGSFCINTNDQFTFKEAKEGRYVVGFGVSTPPQTVKDIGPFAMFCPSPNTQYEITPSNIYYVIARPFNPRDSTTEFLENAACKINFSASEPSNVSLVHDEHGTLSAIVNKEGSN